MAGGIICGKCGTPNAPGDQFCGSCGAFLEWQPGDGGHEPLEPSPPPTSPQLPDRPGAGAVVCAVCGTVTPAGRTFCQRCGARLAVPTGATKTASVATVPPPGGQGGDKRSGGLPGWLPIVLGLGLLVGLVAVGAAFVLGSLRDPTSVATSAPGLSPTLTPTLAAGSASVSSQPTVLERGSLTLTAATASSVAGDGEVFAADKVIDGRLGTSWQEGAAEEQGEWIEVSFEAATVEYVVIYGGYQLSHDTYLGYRRPNEVLVSIDAGAPTLFRLADVEQPQRLDVDDVSGATSVRIEVVSTYDPQSTAHPGSPFDDMAISEIRVSGYVDG